MVANVRLTLGLKRALWWGTSSLTKIIQYEYKDRMLGCMDPVDYDQLHFCICSYLILCLYLILCPVYFPGISFF